MDKNIKRIIIEALKEDCACFDVTSRLLLPKAQRCEAKIFAKEAGVLCGVKIAKAVFLEMDSRMNVQIHKKDGEKVSPMDIVLTVQGESSKILSAERTALNFLQHLSGVASLTWQFVEALKGAKAKIFDTRKTIPTLRFLQKYAVRCGRGFNHRMDLNEMVMVKDNHLFLTQSQPEQLRDLKSKCAKEMVLVIEAKTLAEVQDALEARADIILLDNMEVPLLKKSIRFIRSKSLKALKYKPLIEVSGGINLKNARELAQCGADRISIGQLTHSAKALDFSLEICRIF